MRPQWLIANLALGILMMAPASAQTANTSSNTTASPSTTTQGQSHPVEIKQKLEKQGFTNVQVVPGSFIVSAKDKDGDPVNMLIGPNSMMVMTSSPVSASTNQGQTK
jgi:hypothetical protein